MAGNTRDRESYVSQMGRSVRDPRSGQRSRTFSSGVRVFAPTQHSSLGQADPYSKNPGQRPAVDPTGPGGYWERQASALLGAGGSGVPTDQLGTMLGDPTGGGSNRRGGGGGGGGVDPARIRGIADELFRLNESPYWMMQAGLNNQRAQAAAYNPDFAGMEATTLAGQKAAGDARSAMIRQRMAELQQLGQTLAGQQGTAIGAATRDLATQGFNPGAYVQQANQMGAERAGGLTNQGAYMTMLDQSAANAQAADARAAGLIRQGGEATLANNRGALYNQLDMGAAQIQQQAAQARLANDQARREFLLRYGVT